MDKDRLFNILLGMFGLFIVIFTLHFFHHYIEDYEFRNVVNRGFKVEEVIISYKFRCPYCGYEDELPITDIKSFKNQEVHFITFICDQCKKHIILSPMAQDSQTSDYSKFNQ